MRMGVRLVFCCVALSLAAFAQVGNGTITGTVTDPAGAVIPGAKVEAKNAETGVVYSTASSSAGVYTVPDLPVGTYTVTVSVMGFKNYVHTNLAVGGAGTVRQDATLQVGASTESVTVSAEASLLKTESAENATNFSLQDMDQLPIFGIGTVNSGTSGYRNPYNTMLTMQGVSGFAAGAAYAGAGTLAVNGVTAPPAMIMEGQDATDRTFGGFIYYQIGQPSVDSLQEIAYQTSNYAPEFGQAGSVAINMTMKSGTNQYHGSGYDNFVNEDLNAGDPFTTTGCIAPIGPYATTKTPACDPTGGSGGKYRPRNRRNDFGGTLGGPIYIPHIYNGRNKSFFFWSYEQYAETTGLSFSDTVPTADYLGGNFGHISPNGDCSLCSQLGIQTTALGSPTVQKDALGNPFYANEIYNPLSRGVVAASGLGYAMPFANNQIPATMFDPLYVKMQTLINTLGATAQNGNLTGNYTGRIQSNRYSAIPSLKLDHNINATNKLSFYYSENDTQSQYSTPLGNADGLPSEIGGYRGTFIPTYTYRLNYDRTLTPTLLLHIGVGYYKDNFDDHAPFLKFDPSQFGLTGFVDTRGNFPYISGMSSTTYGGMQPIGTALGTQGTNYGYKPTATTNMTWVHGKHTFKVGADLQINGIINQNHSVVQLATSTAPTSEPFTPTGSLGAFGTGFGYASWMLGDYISTNQPAPTDPHFGSKAWDWYIQDSWKVTRKLTLDYGLRWDMEQVQHEEYNRVADFSLTAPNQNAGGHPGSTIFANTCNCSFYQKNYPYGFGPRIGVAYQIDSKTVFRGGWGVTYPYTVPGNGTAYGLVSTPGSYTIVPPQFAAVNLFVNEQTPGFIQPATWPVTNNLWPVLGTAGVFGQTPVLPDANQNRPPRIQQFSLGFQREITRSFVVEAKYVGNRSVWLGGSLGYLADSNHLPWQDYANLGIYPLPGTGPAGYNFDPAGLTGCVPGNDCARAILSQSLSATSVIQTLAAAGLKSPSQYIPYNCPGTSNFSCFPLSGGISSILRSFPQYGAIGPAGSPTGNAKYDSLQVSATKRLSHNLTANGFFTWAQGFTRATRQDFYNPQSDQNALQQIPPRTLNINFQYMTPRAQFLDGHNMKFVNQVIKDWQITGTANYQSAAFLALPTTPNAEELGTETDIYNGAPLYLDKNGNPTNNNPLNNAKSINTQQQVLNPAAWTLCPVNTNCGTGILMKNFRGVRHPYEDAGIGRNFRIKERMNFQIRGDFINIFNRSYLPSPSTTNPQTAITHNTLGYTTGGFGTMPIYTTPGTPLSVAGTAVTGRTGTLVARFTF